jgi:hypothetical protein
MSTAAQEPYLKQKIDYTKALTRELVSQHAVEWRQEGKKLLSAVLFGPLAADEWSEEIWLLEVVRGYPYPSNSPEPSSIKFKSTRQFPMYGHLRLWVWSPKEIRDAVSNDHPFIEQIRAEAKEYLVDHGDLAKKLLG